MKIVVFNAPKRSGKDFGAGYLCKKFGAKHFAMKDCLYDFSSKFLSISREEFLQGYDDKTKDVLFSSELTADYTQARKYYGEMLDAAFLPEWWKDVKCHQIGREWFSKREVLIHVSENTLKPMLGNDFIGVSVAAQMKEVEEDVPLVVSDCGFIEEVLPVIDTFGRKNVFIVHIDREGCTFEGDSRKLITRNDFEENTCPRFKTMYNDGTSEFTRNLGKFVQRIMYE